MMDIVFNIDDRYARHCAVTMASIIRNSPGEEIHFHILELAVSEKNKKKLRRMLRDGKLGISFYPIEESLVKNLPNLDTKKYLSAATYIRLYMAELIPENIHKVLYIDCDMVVRHDNIRELWETDMAGYAIAAAEDPAGNETWLETFRTHGYFNAGMFVANLDYWRKNNVTAQFNEFLEKYSEKIIAHDQDVLNGVLYDKRIVVPIQWNVFSSLLDEWRKDADPEFIGKYGGDPYIVHYAGPEKPWNSVRYHPFFKDYHKYRRYTPWMRPVPSWKEASLWGKPKHVIRSYLGLDKYFTEKSVRKMKEKKQLHEK